MADYRGLFLIIIKFRYNARADWLKQHALSEYRCTEQWCHAVSPFVKFLDFSLVLSLFFDPNVFYNLENENELLASMDIDHPVLIHGKNRTNNTVFPKKLATKTQSQVEI